MPLDLDDRAPKGAGAPDPEIEITPEMIEAGRTVILVEIGGAYGCGGTYFDAEEVARKVYQAMAHAMGP